MFYGDIYLVYDLLEVAVAKERFQTAVHLANFGCSRPQVVRCLGLLWQQGLIHAPSATLRQDGITISLSGGVTDAGRAAHELLRKTLWGISRVEVDEGDVLPRPGLHLVC